MALRPHSDAKSAIGGGLEFAVARVFPFSKDDRVSPPSTVGTGGIFTNNGSRGIAFGGRLYFKEDKYRMTLGIGSASLNVDIYGVGSESGTEGTFVPLNTEGGGGVGEFLFRLRKNVYLGMRGQYRNLEVSLDREKLDDPEITTQPPEEIADVIEQLQGDLLRQKTVSQGPRFQWDTRDNVFSARQGILAEIATDFFGQSIGSKYTYQFYKGCAASGDHVPIYDLCLFGTENDLRGYPGGRFQDRRMFATQGEYRLMFPSKGFLGRLGVVAFAGVGAVAPTFSELTADDLLPAGGGGLRFRLLKKYPINFRVDYGFGKVGNTLSIGVLEAF